MKLNQILFCYGSGVLGGLTLMMPAPWFLLTFAGSGALWLGLVYVTEPQP